MVLASSWFSAIICIVRDIISFPLQKRLAVIWEGPLGSDSSHMCYRSPMALRGGGYDPGSPPGSNQNEHLGPCSDGNRPICERGRVPTHGPAHRAPRVVSCVDQKRSEILLGAPSPQASLASPTSDPAIILVDVPHGHGRARRLPPAPSPRIVLSSRGRRPPSRVPVAAQAALRRRARRSRLQPCAAAAARQRLVPRCLS